MESVCRPVGSIESLRNMVEEDPAFVARSCLVLFAQWSRP